MNHRPTGNAFILTLLMLLAPTLQAEVTASVDRQRIAFGDSLRLTLTADDDEELSEADLRPLLDNFDILQRSTNSSLSIVNGVRTHTKELLVDIAPRHEGILSIPAMRVGSTMTNPVQVIVSPAPDVASGGQSLLFEAEVDRDQVYVQEQIILTLRILQAINLENRSLSEFTLDNAFIKPLEQQSYQRAIEGRPWLVHELRFAIFPEQSGQLDIPAQVFTATEAQGRRSFFDRGNGRRLRRTSEPLTVEVLPRPTDFPGATWLPARNLQLEETWSTPPEELQVGESATRTIRITGEGLQAAQLPPVQFRPIDGLKYYPDQPQVREMEVASGLEGVRIDSAALVPTQSGQWQIPEIRIPWWDTTDNQLRFAVLPARGIDVAPGIPLVSTVEPLAPPAPAVPSDGDAAAIQSGAVWPWQLLGGISTAGWLATLWVLWRNRQTPTPEPAQSVPATSQKIALKTLLSACRDNDATQARRRLIHWARSYSNNPSLSTLEQVAALFSDKTLTESMFELDRALYQASNSSWSGRDLAACVERLDRLTAGAGRTTKPLRLYPQAA
ncbi:MAG: BatD family protein [Pseudomonadota bacterium]